MDIYDSRFVEALFDEMSTTYEAMNYATSFGFSLRWRRQFVARAAIPEGGAVCELMCGMGECWSAIAPRLGAGGRLTALDISAGMLGHASRRLPRHDGLSITLLKEDALSSSIPDASADCLLCAYGVKTFSPEQQRRLAAEIRRILKPGGSFSLVEVSKPAGWALEGLYMFYLKRVIPVIGRLMLGNPENYRMLGVYTENFGDCRALRDMLAAVGLEARFESYFFGCATGVSGRRPA